MRAYIACADHQVDVWLTQVDVWLTCARREGAVQVFSICNAVVSKGGGTATPGAP